MIGLDEVGRGAWAGPVVVASVQLSSHIEGLNDSKQLSRLQRMKLCRLVQQQADSIGIGWIHAQYVDTKGLQASVAKAAEIAFSYHSNPSDDIIIDGKDNWLPSQPKASTLIKADASVQAVSAASIVAKVLRDTYMAQLDAATMNVYGFATHVGYGTAAHRAALEQHGVTSLHRKSYKPIQEIIATNR